MLKYIRDKTSVHSIIIMYIEMILYRGFFCVSLCARVRVGALKGLKGGHIFFISFFLSTDQKQPC